MAHRQKFSDEKKESLELVRQILSIISGFSVCFLISAIKKNLS